MRLNKIKIISLVLLLSFTSIGSASMFKHNTVYATEVKKEEKKDNKEEDCKRPTEHPDITFNRTIKVGTFKQDKEVKVYVKVGDVYVGTTLYPDDPEFTIRFVNKEIKVDIEDTDMYSVMSEYIYNIIKLDSYYRDYGNCEGLSRMGSTLLDESKTLFSDKNLLNNRYIIKVPFKDKKQYKFELKYVDKGGNLNAGDYTYELTLKEGMFNGMKKLFNSFNKIPMFKLSTNIKDPTLVDYIVTYIEKKQNAEKVSQSLEGIAEDNLINPQIIKNSVGAESEDYYPPIFFKYTIQSTGKDSKEAKSLWSVVPNPYDKLKKSSPKDYVKYGKINPKGDRFVEKLSQDKIYKKFTSQAKDKDYEKVEFVKDEDTSSSLYNLMDDVKKKGFIVGGSLIESYLNSATPETPEEKVTEFKNVENVTRLYHKATDSTKDNVDISQVNMNDKVPNIVMENQIMMSVIADKKIPYKIYDSKILSPIVTANGTEDAKHIPGDKIPQLDTLPFEIDKAGGNNPAYNLSRSIEKDTYGGYGYHQGWDIGLGLSAGQSTDKQAIASGAGIAEYLPRNGSRGNVVNLGLAGTPFILKYQHLSGTNFKAKSISVKEGANLGLIGASGVDKNGNYNEFAYSTHLHFEVAYIPDGWDSELGKSYRGGSMLLTGKSVDEMMKGGEINPFMVMSDSAIKDFNKYVSISAKQKEYNESLRDKYRNFKDLKSFYEVFKLNLN